MSLTSRIQDQKDHITQVKKDLCSKVGISSEHLPSFSEIIGSVPSPTLSDIIKWDIPETYQEGIVTYNFQSFQRPWIKICGPNQLITEINYVASSSDIIQFGFFNYNGNIYIMYQVKAETNTADYMSTFILNNIGQIDKIFPKEKYANRHNKKSLSTFSSK